MCPMVYMAVSPQEPSLVCKRIVFCAEFRLQVVQDIPTLVRENTHFLKETVAVCV